MALKRSSWSAFAIILDHMWVQEHLGGGPEIEAVPFFDWHAPWQRPIRSPSLIPAFYILIFSSLFKLAPLSMIGPRKLNGWANVVHQPASKDPTIVEAAR